MRLSPFERRRAIVEILCRERQTTTEKLASALGVTMRTIRNDITALSFDYPIETVRGRYGGGVKLADWFHPHTRLLSPEQEDLLRRLRPTLVGRDLVIINSILAQFSSPHELH